MNEVNKNGLDKPKNLLNVLLNPDNTDPIILMDESGKKIKFEQVAIIPHRVGDKDELYVVLKPLDKLDGIGNDEAVVFKVVMRFGQAALRAEEDELIAIEVFYRYYDLLEEAQSEKKDKGE